MKVEIIYTNERLKEIGIKPDLFYYTVDQSSEFRDYNKSFALHVLRKDMQPLCVAYAHVNTASYRGDSGTIHNLIAQTMGKKMADGYRLKAKGIKIFSM